MNRLRIAGLLVCGAVGVLVASAASRASLPSGAVGAGSGTPRTVRDDYSGPYDADGMGLLAGSLKAPEYFVLPYHGGLSVQFGWLVEIGEDAARTVTADGELSPGLYRNLSGESVTFVRGKSDVFELADRGLILTCSAQNTKGDLRAAFVDSERATGGVRVICRSGFYACCNSTPAPATAKCVADGTNPPPTCQAGGPGSSECEVSE